MTESRPGEDVAQRIERDADELEHDLHKLDDHISEAHKAADARRAEVQPGEEVAGDWDQTGGTPGQGEDPEGAVGEDAGGVTPHRDDPIGSRMPGHPSGGDD
jgi:hypothetical protein